MCGITGLYRLDGNAVDVQRIVTATHTLRHRGPDDEGYWLCETATGRHSLRNGPDSAANIHYPLVDAPTNYIPNLVLAHRRLAIIDLSPGGHEPMTVEGEHVWVTFNGEIYNYLELRQELTAKGYGFRTESDVEVLLQAYNAWGLNCLQRFVGMFAFALWDQPRRRLWCVRDRWGIKPFYYLAQPEAFAFASEVKALHMLTPCRPHLPALFEFVQHGYRFQMPNTLFENVHELPGGHYLLAENGQVSGPVCWWHVDLERARATYDYHRPHEELLRLLDESIALRLRSDVPVGTCLSGGLDSSAIVGLATRQLHGDSMNSFSVIYREKGMDESRYVDMVAQQFHTLRHDFYGAPPSDFLEQARHIVWHQDMPVDSPGIYSQNQVMRLAHGHVTVLLDGQGSDEVFGGYISCVLAHLRALRREQPLRWLYEQLYFMAEAWSRFNPSLNARQFAFLALQYLRGRHKIRLLTSTAQIEADCYRAELNDRLVRPRLGGDALNEFLYSLVRYDSLPKLLHYEDRNSMAYSIEARVPFLDHRLVEFGLGLPASMKLRGPETKLILRQALRGILPEAVIERKDKLGYPSPLGPWMRGPLRTAFEQYLHDTVFRREGYDTASLRLLWQQHANGQRSLEHRLWRLITAEMWLEHYGTA